MKKPLPLFLVVLFSLSAYPLEAKEARCLLKVDGNTYINGKCEFDPTGGGDFKITSDDGYWFAYVNVDSANQATGHWNGEQASPNSAPIPSSHAHTPLGVLNRQDACWSNIQTTVCAW